MTDFECCDSAASGLSPTPSETRQDRIRRWREDMQVHAAEIVTEQRAAGWPDIHPEDYCHLCGGVNPVWWTDSDRWNLAMDGGIACPGCFVQKWEQATGLTAIWRLVPEDVRARSILGEPGDDR